MAQPFTPMLPPATLATLPFTPPLSLTSQLQHQLRLLALLLLLLLRRRRQVVELAVALAVEQVLTSKQACRLPNLNSALAEVVWYCSGV